MYRYLGSYKYDNKIFSISQLSDINTTRLMILNDIAERHSYWIGWGCLIALVFIRYITMFYKWLYPK